MSEEITGLFKSKRDVVTDARRDADTERKLQAVLAERQENERKIAEEKRRVAMRFVVTDGERTVYAYDPDYKLFIGTVKGPRSDEEIARAVVRGIYGRTYARVVPRKQGGVWIASVVGGEYEIRVCRYDTGFDSERKKRMPVAHSGGVWRMEAWHKSKGKKKLSVVRYFCAVENNLRMIRTEDFNVICDGVREGRTWKPPKRVV